MLAYTNILDRLRVDPGQRTLGELLQDRETALHEIRRLRREIEQLRQIRENRRETSAAVPSAIAARNFHSGMLLRISTVCELVGVCRSTVYRWISEGHFPEPVKISERAVRWKIDDIEAWRNAL